MKDKTYQYDSPHVEYIQGHRQTETFTFTITLPFDAPCDVGDRRSFVYGTTSIECIVLRVEFHPLGRCKVVTIQSLD